MSRSGSLSKARQSPIEARRSPGSLVEFILSRACCASGIQLTPQCRLPDSCPSPATDLEATPRGGDCGLGSDARASGQDSVEACDFREVKVAKLRSAVSSGYVRGRQLRDRTGD
jgi:hypothetical protein